MSEYEQKSFREGTNLYPPLTLDQARRVPWVQGKGPMGELLDSGAIGRKDLEWASQKAYRQDQREAALVLLQHLDQAQPSPTQTDGEPPRYGPRVVVGCGYLEEQQEVEWFKVGMLAGFALLGLVLYGQQLFGALRRQEWVSAAIVLGVGIAFYVLIWRCPSGPTTTSRRRSPRWRPGTRRARTSRPPSSRCWQSWPSSSWPSRRAVSGPSSRLSPSRSMDRPRKEKKEEENRRVASSFLFSLSSLLL